MNLAIIFAVVLLGLLGLASGFCPQHCDCINAYDRATVKCPPQSDLEVIPITLNPSIRELDLVGNRIRAVDASFQFYGQLEKVDFSHNEISELPPGCFSSQKRLLSLRLDHNHLTNLTAESFGGLRSLRELSLADNQIGVVDGGLFKHLAKLESLDLSGNLVTVIGEDSFKGLNNLGYLSLSRNHFKALTITPTSSIEEETSTAGSTSLDAFLPLKSLRTLNMSSCGLSFVPAQMLRPLSQTLHSLDLSANEFEDPLVHQVPGLAALTRLTKVRLGGNRLRDLPGIPDSLQSIIRVDLSGSRQLWRVQLSSLTRRSSLKEIILDKCSSLTSFDSSGVEDLSRISALVDSRREEEEEEDLGLAKPDVRLSLRGEGWTRVPSGLVQSLRQLGLNVELDLERNPLKCDCRLQELRSFLLWSDRSNSSSVECASPRRLEGRALINLAEEEMLCDDGDDGDDVFVSSSDAKGGGGIGLPLAPSDQALLIGFCVISALATGLLIFVVVHCRSRLRLCSCCHRGNNWDSTAASKSCGLCCSNRCFSSSSSLSSTASSPLSLEPAVADCFCCQLSSTGKIRRQRGLGDHHRHPHPGHHPHHLSHAQVGPGSGPYTTAGGGGEGGNPYGVPVTNIYRTSGFDFGQASSSSSSTNGGGGYASTLRGGSAHRAAQQYYAALSSSSSNCHGATAAPSHRQSSNAFDTVNTKTSSLFGGGGNNSDDDYFISLTMAEHGRPKTVKPIPVSEL